MLGNLYVITENDGGTNVGYYTVILTLINTEYSSWEGKELGEADYELTFGITVATNVWTTDPAVSDWEYNGKPAARGETLFGAVTVEYKTEDGEYSTEIPVNVGSYTVRFTPENSDNWTELDAVELTFEISKANADVTAFLEMFRDTELTYGDVITTVEPSAVPKGVTVTYIYRRGEEQIGDTAKVNAGTYTVEVIFTLNDPDNYNAVEGKTVTVIVRKVSVALPVVSEKVYNGETQTADLAESDVYTAENTGGINAGTYDVILTLIDTDNYEWQGHERDGSVTLKFKIAKATYDMSGVKFGNASVEYDGEAHSVTVTGTLPDGVEVTYTGNAQTEVGTYKVTAKFSGDSENYNEIADMTAELKITKKADPTNPDDPVKDPGEPEKSNATLGIILGAGGGLSLLLVILLIVLLIKKKRK